MKILLIGKNGQVGWELQRSLAPFGEVIAVGRSEMDLSSPDTIRRVIRYVKPDLIVNAAAYTAVDKAESEPELAMQINGVAPGIMAEEAKRIGATIAHYSTDYVFDGTKQFPYTEEDKPSPINTYGKTKLAGDLAVQGAGIPYLIFRTSWIYGSRGNNFVLTMLRLARQQKEIRVVDDQVGAPTWCRDVAEATAKVICKPIGPLEGVYNLVAAGAVSWFGFAAAILQNYISSKEITLLPISSELYGAPALRPKRSLLDATKLRSSCGLSLRDWNLALTQCQADLPAA